MAELSYPILSVYHPSTVPAGKTVYLYFASMIASLVLVGIYIFWFTQHWGFIGFVTAVIFVPVLTPLFPFIARFMDGTWPLEWLAIFALLIGIVLAMGALRNASVTQ